MTIPNEYEWKSGRFVDICREIVATHEPTKEIQIELLCQISELAFWLTQSANRAKRRQASRDN